MKQHPYEYLCEVFWSDIWPLEEYAQPVPWGTYRRAPGRLEQCDTACESSYRLDPADEKPKSTKCY